MSSAKGYGARANPSTRVMGSTPAARLGRRAQALEVLEKGYAALVLPPFSITAEYDPQGVSMTPKVFPEQELAGPFIANLGAFLTSCIYGFTGLRLDAASAEHWFPRPVQMPKGWDGVEIERLWIRGRQATLTANHGDKRGRIQFKE